MAQSFDSNMTPTEFEPAACGLADKGINPARLYFYFLEQAKCNPYFE